MTTSLIIDIVIAALLVLSLIIGGKRGFIRSLLSVVILVVSLLGSSIVANMLADPVTDNAALAKLVDFDAITGIARKAMDSAVEAGKNLLEGAVTGMVRSLVYAVLFLLSFLLLTLLLRLVTSPLHLAERAPVLGALNRLAGAALGLCIGILVMFAAASVVQWTGLVDAATMKDTYLLKYFAQHSPMDIIALL